jgi:dihydrofolate reductase
VDHLAGRADEELHRFHTESLQRADALLYGRVTYELMEYWREPVDRPEWMQPFARAINEAKKYLVSSTREQVDWNTELLRGDLGTAVQQLKEQPGRGILVGGVTLPLALAELDLIDEYEFVVVPRLAGHGPTLFEGLSKYVDLKLVGTEQLASGAVVLRYEPVR